MVVESCGCELLLRSLGTSFQVPTNTGSNFESHKSARIPPIVATQIYSDLTIAGGLADPVDSLSFTWHEREDSSYQRNNNNRLQHDKPNLINLASASVRPQSPLGVSADGGSAPYSPASNQYRWPGAGFITRHSLSMPRIFRPAPSEKKIVSVRQRMSHDACVDDPPTKTAFSPIPSLAFASFVSVAPLSGTATFSAPLTVYDRSDKMRALSMGAGGLREEL